MKRLFGGIAAAVVAICTPAGAQCLHWEKVSDTGPSPRLSVGMAYDAKRGVTVLMGGANGEYPDWDHYGDTWEWDGTAWTLVDAGGEQRDPPARVEPAMCFDSARGVSVMNGGANVSLPPEKHHVGGTWEWDGAVWTLRTMGGPLPRHSHDMCFDSGRGRSVLFGDRHNDPDTWEWDGTEWFYRGTGGPPNRGWAGLAYDAERGESVLFGGYTPDFVLLGDTWAWDGDVWEQRFPANTPGARANPAMAYDSHRRVIVLVAGESVAGYQSDVWQWDGTDWAQVDAPGLPKRANHAMVYDSARRRMVVFGGIVNGNTFLGDTWELVSNYADCDGSGSLDIDDFICFQTLFGAGDPDADCDGSGGLDVDDFICFQTAYGAGCP